MNLKFGSMADEFFCSSRLFLKLDMSQNRDTLLHFFEQVRKAFPSMKRFRRREDGCLILEEISEERGSRRWVRLDLASLRFGHYAPQNEDDFRKLAAVVLEQAPYHLSLSELDFDHLEVVYCFDLEYRGNHDELVGETLWADHPIAGFFNHEGAVHVIDAQPYFGIALSANCEIQAYAEIKSRTNTYEVRTGEYEAHPLSVFLTVRRYWGMGDSPPLLDAHRDLLNVADELAADKIVPILVNPLAQAIASRS